MPSPAPAGSCFLPRSATCSTVHFKLINLRCHIMCNLSRYCNIPVRRRSDRDTAQSMTPGDLGRSVIIREYRWRDYDERQTYDVARRSRRWSQGYRLWLLTRTRSGFPLGEFLKQCHSLPKTVEIVQHGIDLEIAGKSWC